MAGILDWLSKKKRLTILIIEDQEDDALLSVAQLKRAGYTVLHERVDTMPALEVALLKPWDIVLADFTMPTMNGIDALLKVRQFNPLVPFIFVSGSINEELAVEAMRMGAQDYVSKARLDRLAPVVHRELREFHIRLERRNAERQTDYLTRFNSLTGLPNRSYFVEFVDRQLASRIGEQLFIVVIYIRLERFRSIYDSLGYEAGIAFLQEVSSRLCRCLPEHGLVGRLSIDEFALMHCALASRTDAEDFALKLFHVLEKPYILSGIPMYSSSSIGVAIYPDNAFTARDLLQKAEIAGHRARDRGGREVLHFEPQMVEDLEERLELQRALRGSVERRELLLNFQPQFDLSTTQVVGLEVLLRWHHRTRGTIRPVTFIPLAEESGLIFPLGEWVLRETFRQVKLWEYAQIPTVTVAINICPRQFHEDDLANVLMQSLNEYAINPKHLTIEITESAITRDPGKAKIILHQLKRHGIQVAICPASDGYLNAAFLKDIVFDYVKIGKMFLDALTKNPDGQESFAAAVQLIQSLSLKVIAECVETEDQYRIVKSIGCDIVQGFFTGEPRDANAIREMLANPRQD